MRYQCSSACLTCAVSCLQLVEALNEDYSDYVGLSGQLSGLEGAVVRMRQPLLEIQVCCFSLLLAPCTGSSIPVKQPLAACGTAGAC